MSDPNVQYVPPNEGATNIQAVVPPSPEVRAKVDALNQEFAEFVRAHREELSKVEGAVSKLDPRIVAIEEKFKVEAQTIIDMDLEIQALRKRTQPSGDGLDPAYDPRADESWHSGFDSWARFGDGAPVEDQLALTRGNAYFSGLERLKPHQVKAYNDKWNAWAATGWDPQNAVATGGLQTNFGPGAGVWARPAFEREITKKLVEYTNLREYARVITIGAGQYIGVIRNTNRDTIEEPGEGVAPTQQTQQDRYETRTISIHKKTAAPALTPEQVEDSIIDIEAELVADVVMDFAIDEGTQLTTGATSTGPKGYAVDSDVTGVTSSTAGTLDHGDITDLMLSLRPFYRKNGVYAVSTTALRLLMLEEDTFGRRLWQPSNQAGIPSLLNGFRFFESTELAAVATAAKPVFFCDWRNFYRIIDRRGLRIVRNELTNPELIQINMSRRYGGRTWLTEAGKALTIA